MGSSILITIMWILVMIQASNSWAYIDKVYIRHGETREAQLGSLLSYRHGELFPISVTNYVVALISILLADTTMVFIHSTNLRDYL